MAGLSPAKTASPACPLHRFESSRVGNILRVNLLISLPNMCNVLWPHDRLQVARCYN